MATHENWLNRKRGKQTADLFKLDTKNKTPEQNIIEIIQGLYVKKQLQNDVSPTSKNLSMDTRVAYTARAISRNGSDGRQLSYLNALVTLLCKEDKRNLGFTIEELMCCIRVSLMDESILIRAAALRALRYMIKTESDVSVFNTLRLPYLVIRSMDLTLRNEEERTQALRVVRQVISVVGSSSPAVRKQRAAFVEPGLLRCLVSIARASNANDGNGDRLARPAIATIADIGIINPSLFVACGGVGAVTRYLQECATPRMAEALCGVLLHTLNEPAVRRAARVDLMCLCSPYCDFHYRSSGSESNRDDREMRFTCSRLALLCVLRSWPGLLHFCHPYNSGGLRALVHALHLPRLEVRKAILDLLYELLGLSLPEWTDEISVALDAVDPSDFQNSWGLNEGFVAAEGVAILPHLSSTGPDITEIHLALLLQCFLEAGLLDGLAEVVVTSDTFISVRATVLLGQLLHLVHLYLPPQISNISPPLPSLLAQAAAGKPQALAAIAALQRLHSMLEARPATNSLFLDHIVQYCSDIFNESDDILDMSCKSRKERDNANMASPKQKLESDICEDSSIDNLNELENANERRQSHSVGSRADLPPIDKNISALVKSKSVTSRSSDSKVRFKNAKKRDGEKLFNNSLVMQNKDGITWDWEAIMTILKERSETSVLNLSESGHRAWICRIVDYLKPSSNKYSHADLSATWHGHSATRAGCQLIRHLIRYNDPYSMKLLKDLFEDLSKQVAAIETGRKAHECLFSPQHMCNTMCQMYFLFIGQLCHSDTGLQVFKETKLYENLLELSTNTHHSCYVKLVISSLDYTKDSYPREILSKTLTCNIQASRMYATQFLNVLLRASLKSQEILRKKMKLRRHCLQERLRSSNKDEDTGLDMNTWILQMLVGQIKDESKAIVKCALSILEEACSVPSYFDKLILMKEVVCENCGLNKDHDPKMTELGTAEDGGYLLWLHLEAAAYGRNANTANTALIKKHLDFWTKHYNYRYVRLVEQEVHGALTLCGEKATTAIGVGLGGLGDGDELARGRGTRRTARPPFHLYAALTAVPLSGLATILHRHYKILKQGRCNTEQEIMDLKSSLWAIGNTANTAQGVQLLMQLSNGCLEESPPVLIVRLARYCPTYGVRAAAVYVLGLIGSTYVGANLLQELGWLCVRHTRHDQFPIIQEDNWSSSSSSGNLHHLIMSPNRRFNQHLCETETSEHSDHTDHSTVESLHSDNTKHSETSRTLINSLTVEHHHNQRDQDTVDCKMPIHKIVGLMEKRKSHTLPSQSGHSNYNERPSLSESRTVDIIRDYSSYDRHGTVHTGPISDNRLGVGRINSMDQSHEGRVRNTSESSTSGVSSCDSVLGRYVFPDRVLTLSPIPSSSSLYVMKGSAQRSRLSDMQRRTSTSSFTAPDAASSPPSQRDMAGYATLKSLNIHRRPHLSESAASGSCELEELTWILAESNRRRTKPFLSLRERTKSAKGKRTMASLMDYDWKPMLGASADNVTQRPPTVTAPSPGRGPPPSVPPADHRGPCYLGICLPLNFMDLFPRGEADEVTLDSFAGDTSFMIDSTTTATESKMLASPENQSFASNKGVSGTGAGDQSWPGGWRHVPNNCLSCVRTRPPSSHELREAFFADLESSKSITVEPLEGGGGSPETSLMDHTLHADVLHHAHYMANPIYHKQSRSALLSLKQRHPEVFKSMCVYSEVSALLATGTYMMCARRFLQELFLDTPPDCFANEPQAILSRHPTITLTLTQRKQN